MYTITAYLKHGNETLGYRVSDGINTKDFSKEDLLVAIKNGIKISNFYMRGNNIVLKSRKGVKEIEYTRPILMTCHSDGALRKIDAKFNFIIAPRFLDDTMLKMIKEIDGAVPADNVYEYGRFITKFGIATLKDLSTGCKAALLFYLAQRNKTTQVISFDSVSANAAKVICEYLSHCIKQYPLIEFRSFQLEYKDELQEFKFKDIRCNKTGGILEIMLEHN